MKVWTLRFFFKSPNLIWFLTALAVHVFAPYDIDGASPKTGVAGAGSWLLRRFVLNFSIALAYYGFFYVGLYHLHWGERKYKEGSYPTLANMAHNLWFVDSARSLVVFSTYETQLRVYFDVMDPCLKSCAPELPFLRYWLLGVVQWTFLEFVMCRAWTTGAAAPFRTNAEVQQVSLVWPTPFRAYETSANCNVAPLSS